MMLKNSDGQTIMINDEQAYMTHLENQIAAQQVKMASTGLTDQEKKELYDNIALYHQIRGAIEQNQELDQTEGRGR